MAIMVTSFGYVSHKLRFPELHDRAARNRSLADAPPLELPPVDVQCPRYDLGQIQRGRWFAVE